MFLLSKLTPVALLGLYLSSFVRGSLTDEILTALEVADDCDSCYDLFVPLKKLAEEGDDAFVTVFTAICIELELEDADVCTGILKLEGPIVAHSFRSISTNGQTATKLCDGLLGLCSPPAVNALKWHFPNSAPRNPKKFVSKGRKPFQVVHFSDVHVDREYVVGSEGNCTKAVCCRNFADQNGTTPTVPAGRYGNSGCDSPVTLADSMLEAVQNFGGSSKFAIFTGDVIEGAEWIVDRKEATMDLTKFNEQMAKKLRMAVYPALGNHDVSPVNAFPRSTSGDNASVSQWVFDTQSAGWAQWIGLTAARQVDHASGSYAIVVPGTNLRIISINTQYWYKQNYWMYDSDVQQPDPNGILAFMTEELQAAEDAGQRAWIIGHIPLGKQDVFNDQSNYYDQIIQRYHNTIAVQFFGHSHKDQFEIAYSDYEHRTAESAVSVAIIGPALTPTSGNPAFKIYDIDPDTFELLDAKVYMTNISDPHFQTRPTWKLYYSAREVYGRMVGKMLPTTPLGPAFWHKLTDVFTANDAAFQLWNTFQTRGGEVSACDSDCKNTTICAMRSFRAESNCDTATVGLSLRRTTETTGSGESDQCEGIRIGNLFSRMIGR